jgi:hypothetical protein
MNFSPPFTSLENLQEQLRSRGYALLGPRDVAALAGVQLSELEALHASWDDLPPDAHLKDGGRYRRRRHSSFIADGPSLSQVPHRAHWQPVEYNALHGGMERWFEPMDPATVQSPAWNKLLGALAQLSQALGQSPAAEAGDSAANASDDSAQARRVELIKSLLASAHDLLATLNTP